MITEKLPVLKINKMTQEQYNREFTAGNIKTSELYLTPVADSIIEVGTSGDWTYRKYESGIAECWGYVLLGTIDISEKMTDGVYSGTDYKGARMDLPAGLFKSISSVNSNVTSNGYTHSQIAAVTTEYFTYRVWASYPAAALSGVRVYFHIIGSWE